MSRSSRIFGELIAPFQLLWGLFFLFPKSAIRSGAFFFAMVGLLIINLLLFGQQLWFYLRRGDDFRRRLREHDLEPPDAGALGNGFLWFRTAAFMLGSYAFAYWGLSLRDSHAFTEALSIPDTFYFAVTTFTTTGYGDLVPRSEAVRLFVTSQMVLGFALVSVGLVLVLSRLGRDDSPRGYS